MFRAVTSSIVVFLCKIKLTPDNIHGIVFLGILESKCTLIFLEEKNDLSCSGHTHSEIRAEG